jgi:hypothetical protein
MMQPDYQSRPLTGSDDAQVDLYLAETAGDEAVGGSTAIPGQNDTEELAMATGVVLDDDEPLALEEMLAERDRDRWELDRDSAA